MEPMIPREFTRLLDRVRKRIRSIEGDDSKSQYGADAFNKLVESITPEGKSRVAYSGLNRRQQIRATKTLQDIDTWKSSSSSGAKQIVKDTYKNLGANHDQYSNQEINAAKELATNVLTAYARANGVRVLGSDQVMALVTEYLNGDKEIEFGINEDGKLVAKVVGRDEDGHMIDNPILNDGINEAEFDRTKREAELRFRNRTRGIKPIRR